MIVTWSLFSIRAEYLPTGVNHSPQCSQARQTHQQQTITEKDTNWCHRKTLHTPRTQLLSVCSQPAGLGLILPGRAEAAAASGSSTRAHRWWEVSPPPPRPDTTRQETPNTQCTGELGRAPQSNTGNTEKYNKYKYKKYSRKRHQKLNPQGSLREPPVFPGHVDTRLEIQNKQCQSFGETQN